MTRAIIKLKENAYINIPADCIDFRDQYIMAWNGENLVAVANADNVELCYLTEQKVGVSNG